MKLGLLKDIAPEPAPEATGAQRNPRPRAD